MTVALNILPRPHSPSQADMIFGKENQIAFCGRRWGKTVAGVDRIILSAVNDPGLYWWVGLSWKSASMKRAWRLLKYIVREMWRATGKSYEGKIRESDKELHLPNGSEIWLRSSENPDSIKGEGTKGVVIDEFTLMQELIWLECVQPTLLDYGGWVFLIGVPAGKNWGYRLWERARMGELPGWKHYHQTTYDNSYIPHDRIDAIRETVPEMVFRQEYLAQALEDGGEVFRRVRDCAVATPQDGAIYDVIEGGDPIAHNYLIGVDWAKTSDFNVFCVIDTNLMQCVHLDRSRHIDYTVQRARLRALWERFNRGPIIAESNAMGTPIIEELQRDGLPVQGFVTNNASKTQIIEALTLAFEQGAIGIIPDDTLIAELESYSSERLPSGLTRYGAPSGMHDDTVMALAIAWHGAATQFDSAYEVVDAQPFTFGGDNW